MNRQPSERKSRGQALVEFALILPLMILLVFGAVDLGRAFFALITITNAAREGARYAIISTDVQVVGGISGTELELIRDVAIAESNSGGIILDRALITAVCDPSCSSGSSLVVNVGYQFNLIMDITHIDMGKSIRMLIP